MIETIPESFLLERLPEGIVSLDERGLISSVVGGYQDRIEDLRSYSRKLELLFQTSGLPETGNNVVLVDIQSDQGKVFTRSIDLQDDTPEDGTAALTAWVLDQLQTVESNRISNVRYGRDLLRLVDANTLDYLASTLGAVLFQSTALTTTEQTTANQQILQTYFPRLKFKGTAESFTALGRILGFDDVKVTPLWSRLSPRVPDDVGNPANSSDFSADPEYQPQQAIDDFYNPLKTNDGPFYTWSGTVSAGTGATDFVTEVVNNKNPWISVSVLRVDYGTVTYPSAGSYALGSSGSNSVGGPHKKAYVEAGGVLFRAIGEGEYFNGLEVHVASSGHFDAAGEKKILTVVDRLSAVKYRSSYFDLAMTAEFDRVEELYGASAMRRNKDLAADPALTADGVAVSPYRPWWAGSISTGSVAQDFLVSVGTNAPHTFVARVQSTGTDRQLNVDGLFSAGVQVVQAFEEVRPATRTARDAGVGFLIRDEVGYAGYTKETRLFTTTGATSYSGSHVDALVAPYYALVALQNGTNRIYAQSVTDPANASGYLFAAPSFSGSFDFTNGSYSFAFSPVAAGTEVFALWKPSSTEVIRVEPGNGTEKAYQVRPEDEEDEPADEVADDVPWRRDLVLGGEIVDLTIYNPIDPDIQIDAVEPVMAVPGHDGADYNVFGINSTTGILRLLTEARTIGADYVQGMPAVAYQGTLRNLATVSRAHGLTDLERLFEPGAKLYTIGNVQGVLVADPTKFYSDAHRQNLVGWFPFNEHVDADLAPVDRSAFATNLTPVNLDPTSRSYDSERGWYLNGNTGSSLLSDKVRFLGSDYALSFWFKPGTATGTLLTYGPLRIDWNGSAIIFYDNEVSFGSVFVSAFGSGFSFIALSRSSDDTILGGGTLTSPLLTWHSTGQCTAFDELDTLMTINGLAGGLSDLRMWNTAKTAAELDTIRDYAPRETVTAYQVGSFLNLNKRERYALKVLATGQAVAAPLPGFYTTARLGAALRYDSLGLYTGEARFKEVGVSGGPTLPTTSRLGQQFYDLAAAGVALVGPAVGLEPGINTQWLGNGTNGTYLRVVQTGSTSFDTFPSSGTTSPWPNPMVATNPGNSSIWVKGDDGYMYELTLESSGTGARPVATFVARERTDAELEISSFGTPYWDVLRYAEQPTGAQTVLSTSGTVLTVGSGGTSVYQKTFAGTQATPPIYLYLNSRVVLDVSDAYTYWTDPSAFGDAQTPPTAALQTNGEMTFEVTGDIVPGNYRLTVVSGNIGKVDPDFDGFSTDITVDATTIQRRLCQGQSGYNFTGTNSFEFAIDNAVSGVFLVSFDWTNAFSDAKRGEARQLAIYSFKLERLVTELYKLSIAGSGITPDLAQQNTETYYGTAAGGWVASMNSYGSVAQWQHESEIYPSNDTLTLKAPLSNILNVSTPDRREDILGPTNIILADAATGTVPAFGTLSDAAVGLVPQWLWSGAVTGNSAVLSARLPSDSPAVQAVVSEYGTIGEPLLWSDFVESRVDNGNTVKIPVSGLQPNKTYYYAIATGGSIATSFVGKFKTWDETTRTFTFALGSCSNNTVLAGVDPVLFDTLRAKDPLFFLHTGDLHYNDSSNEPSSISQYQNCYDKVFQLSARQKQFWQNVVVPYVWDDHDFGSNDSDGTYVNKTAARLAYQATVPHYPLAAGTGDVPIYHSFSVGRCYFIVLDVRSEADDHSKTDDASKTRLGATQKAWLKQQLLFARDYYAVTFVVTSVVWGGAASAGSDTWAGYSTERREIIDFIVSNDISGVFLLSGDMHACALDDGTNNAFGTGNTGGMIIFQAAPLSQAASQKGTPYSVGPYPASGSATKNQYGMVTVVDYGTTTPFLTFKAFDDTSASDTLLFTSSFYGTQSPVP